MTVLALTRICQVEQQPEAGVGGHGSARHQQRPRHYSIDFHARSSMNCAPFVSRAMRPVSYAATGSHLQAQDQCAVEGGGCLSLTKSHLYKFNYANAPPAEPVEH